ncbi:condensation domain-containing protein [Kitasatospora sp. A2-31]|uniref:condensation domain-containing protein n=1 Tax=Kitasatospora sp. A2-31 TaxID=2916414 RepID=UPI001EEBD079|nr:condensation domain-containing protein [Kitasatospora sp. A2-31]MCG6498310.1 condensation domain-containing protein [Kitasatospora sp. A2-31]
MSGGTPRTHATEPSLEDVRQAVAGLLQVEPGTIGDADNLIRHGMDSIRMMRLAGGWRRTGADVSFQKLAETPTVEHWHRLLTVPAAVAAAPEATAAVRPPVETGAPFDLTPVQRAYWIGRGDDMALGGVGCHAYLEFDGRAVEPARLEAAVRQVAQRHGMLRATFLDDGRQRILDRSPWPGLTVHDLTAAGGPGGPAAADQAGAAVEQGLAAVRAGLSHRRLDVAAGEVFDVQLSLLPGGRTRIHLNIDLLVADVASIEVLLADLAAAYRAPERLAPAGDYGFAQYLADYRASAGSPADPGSPLAAAQRYWKELLPELPTDGPRLPLAKLPGELGRTRFSRRSFVLGAQEWQRITARAREHGLTTAMVLATAYAEVLGAWSEEPAFLLNVPLFDRQPLHPAVAGMIADFTNLVLLPVDLSRPAPFAERVRGLQRSVQRNASHAQYPTLNVLRDLRRAHGGRRVGAPVVFACNLGSDFVAPDFRAELGELTWMLSQTPQVWLDHQVYRTDDSVQLAWDAVDELFPAGLLDAMLGAYRALLERLGAAEDRWHLPAEVAAGAAADRAAADRAAAEPTAAEPTAAEPTAAGAVR